MYFSLFFIANIGPPSNAGSAWLTENVLLCKVRVLCLLHFLAKLKTELPTIDVNISFVCSRHCVSHKLRYFMSRRLTSFVRNSARLSFPTIHHSRFVLFLLEPNTGCSFVIGKPWLVQSWPKLQTRRPEPSPGLTTGFSPARPGRPVNKFWETTLARPSPRVDGGGRYFKDGPR